MNGQARAIVLAAGQSTRLKSTKTKLLETMCGQEIVLYPIKLLHDLKIPITVVIGHQWRAVQSAIMRDPAHADISFVKQTTQLGRGNAVAGTQQTWDREHLFIINGDTPLITSNTLERLWKKHIQTNAAISLVTAHTHDSSSGNHDLVITEGHTIRIVPARYADSITHDPCCIDAGIYLIRTSFLTQHTAALTTENEQQLHIGELVEIAAKAGELISSISAALDEVRSIDTYQDLWGAEQVQRAQLIKYWMQQGVRFGAAQNVHLDLGITIGSGSFIGSGVHLTKNSTIGERCTIEAFSIIENSVIASDTTVRPYSIIIDSKIGSQATIGPFAHIKQNSTIGNHSQIGNFVEVTRSTIGEHTKAKHLSYLGDASIGSHVNVGAGSITCNQAVDRSKHVVTIEDHAYLGSNSLFIAPVTVKSGAITAAGSTITEDVPQDTLAIARCRQENKIGYASVLRNKATQPEEPQQTPIKKAGYHLTPL